MLVYIPYMDPMGNERDFWIICVGSEIGTPKSISDSLKIVYFWREVQGLQYTVFSGKTWTTVAE